MSRKSCLSANSLSDPEERAWMAVPDDVKSLHCEGLAVTVLFESLYPAAVGVR